MTLSWLFALPQYVIFPSLSDTGSFGIAREVSILCFSLWPCMFAFPYVVASWFVFHLFAIVISNAGSALAYQTVVCFGRCLLISVVLSDPFV